jgi:hypothetical protein
VSEQLHLVLRTLAIGGDRALRLADAIQALTLAMWDRETGGVFEAYQYLSGAGELVEGRKFPAVWFDRLATAIEGGALERMSTDRIVERMLQGPR